MESIKNFRGDSTFNEIYIFTKHYFTLEDVILSNHSNSSE